MTTRKGRQARNRLLANRIILALLVLVVVGALYGLVKIIRPVALTSAVKRRCLNFLLPLVLVLSPTIAGG